MPQAQQLSFLPLLVAFYSTLQNEGLYQWVVRRAKAIDSQLLFATAWHQRADALSSVVVFFGLLGRWFGFGFADLIAAVIVGLLIIKMAVGILLQAADELIDRSVTKDDYELIWRAIEGVEGVIQLRSLRTRVSAGQVYMDATVLLDENLSFVEACRIKALIKSQLADLAGVLIADVLIDVVCLGLEES